jgi:hypothetical protein
VELRGRGNRLAGLCRGPDGVRLVYWVWLEWALRECGKPAAVSLRFAFGWFRSCPQVCA